MRFSILRIHIDKSFASEMEFFIFIFLKLSSLLPIGVVVAVFGKAIFSLYGLQINKYDLLLLRWACYMPLDICQHNDGLSRLLATATFRHFYFQAALHFFIFIIIFVFAINFRIAFAHTTGLRWARSVRRSGEEGRGIVLTFDAAHTFAMLHSVFYTVQFYIANVIAF